MDLNGDGNIDILSGSYSRMEPEMAGLFQVLYGTEKGTFKAAEVLNGTDGEPLIIPAEEMTDNICTRPTAVDLDGDGNLDIVSGNFTGTFFVFKGVGKGAFSAECTQLMVGEDPLRVAAHSDPFLVDWDDDGDLDLLSGSAQGGVFIATNTGSKTAPRFSSMTELIAPGGPRLDPYAAIKDPSIIKFGDASVLGPSDSTRVWVADLNGDRKLDVLVGDTAQVIHPLEGRDEETTRKDYVAWLKRETEHTQNYPQEPSEEAQKAWSNAYFELIQEREKIVEIESTGFVWVYYQK